MRQIGPKQITLEWMKRGQKFRTNWTEARRVVLMRDSVSGERKSDTVRCSTQRDVWDGMEWYGMGWNGMEWYGM
eukprot:CAMPEP_0172376594 /NCGR_PEP_ID=MMETSP1060-20121228/67829_1 /TAXON_ID=37318 /ORGANISM="Pseudo-nitzschia pungens, Strain cf. cingulata" /LENGTH=73 /DNA_ID=CAMNT_0013104193 /DNA_START=26 /DNA_END=244 /DNA_ORIENTATION=-